MAEPTVTRNPVYGGDAAGPRCNLDGQHQRTDHHRLQTRSTRKKVAEGETPNQWTDYTVDDGNGGQTTELLRDEHSVTVPDLAAGDTYEAQVRAITSEEAEGPWSDTGEGRANRPPNKTYANPIDRHLQALRHHHCPPYSTPSGPYGVFFEDADGDTLSRPPTLSHIPGIISVWVERGRVGRIWASYDNPGSRY